MEGKKAKQSVADEEENGENPLDGCTSCPSHSHLKGGNDKESVATAKHATVAASQFTFDGIFIFFFSPTTGRILLITAQLL